ncbi:hypothetical protein CROQUDRAFT_651330 [Cronartium quercuum f. sp. fusiforme G11]|uniref:J domain-containing protein n=1 Tax=Cronartium quercuum f. sp. fusiforme G11 TaxID=708437 RepID=A0A9P6TG76_9BASI|nr:hypothetical protein CROQUDRAFT_651330 [Cronartium quercuum f. sp. fusiforme G11]
MLPCFRTIFNCHSPCKLSPTSCRSHFSTGPSGFYPSTTFPFPRHPYPTPYEIFHLPQTATTADIKSRYYELVKLHHPDIDFANSQASQEASKVKSSRKSEFSDSANHFKAIVEAYELLKSPSRRQLYLNSGEGWPRPPSSINRGSRGYRTSQRSSSTSRPYRPLYPSSLWDWASSGLGARSSHYTSPQGDYWFSARYTDPRASTFSQQWQRDGLLAKNGIFISSLGCVGVLFYCFQVWKIMPLLDGHSQKDANRFANTSQQIREPIGDERLDQEAWRRLSHAPLPASTSSSTPSQQTPPELGQLQAGSTLSYPHVLAPKSYVEGLDRQSRKTARDLKEARAAAIPASQLLRSRPVEPHA